MYRTPHTGYMCKALLATLIAGLGESLRWWRVGPQFRYYVWLAALIILLIPPLFVFPVLKIESGQTETKANVSGNALRSMRSDTTSLPVVAENSIATDERSIVTTDRHSAAPGNVGEAWPRRLAQRAADVGVPYLLGAVWLGGFLLVISRHLLARRLMARLLRHATLAPRPLVAMQSHLCRELKLANCPTLVTAAASI